MLQLVEYFLQHKAQAMLSLIFWVCLLSDCHIIRLNLYLLFLFSLCVNHSMISIISFEPLGDVFLLTFLLPFCLIDTFGRSHFLFRQIWLQLQPCWNWSKIVKG
jgi:hypothetical protein